MPKGRTIINPKPGERLKEIRDDYGLSQPEMAKKVFQSQQSISRMELGKKAVQTETAIAYAKAFPEIRVYWILGIDDYKTHADYSAHMTAQSQHESDALYLAFETLVKSAGYTCKAPRDGLGENATRDLLKLTNGNGSTPVVAIAKDERSFLLTADELTYLEEEITSIVGGILAHRMHKEYSRMRVIANPAHVGDLE